MADARSHDQLPSIYIGVDIGSDILDFAAHGIEGTCGNDPSGFRALLAATNRLRTQRHFICEPTGQYGIKLVSFLLSKRCRVSVVSGSRVRQFAKAAGRKAKTDRFDAKLLAEFGEWSRPDPMKRPSNSQMALSRAVRFRWQLERLRQVVKRQHGQQLDSVCRKRMGEVLKVVSAQLKHANGMVDAAVASDPHFRDLSRVLTTVVGVGPRAAATFLAELPELGSADRRRIASLVGVAPFNDDSGTFVGGAIEGGRIRVRNVLFMCAMVAVRHNEVLRPVYEGLRKRGKPHRVALVAVMRRLLVHLNTLSKKFIAAPDDFYVRRAPNKAVTARWSGGEVETLKRLVAERVICKAIAVEMGRSVQAVSAKIVKLRKKGAI